MKAKLVLGVVAAIVLIPLAGVVYPKILELLPEPLTFDRVEEALDAAYWVTDAAEVDPPGLDAVAHRFMRVDGYLVNLYRYKSEGKIAKQLEFQRPDAGSVVVEAWNLSERLGAAKSRNIPTSAGRNGMFMVTVQSENSEFRRAVVALFKSL